MKKTIFTLICIVAVGALVANAALTPSDIAAREARKAAQAATENVTPFTGTLSPRVVDVSRASAGTLQYDTGVFTGVGNMPALALNFSFGNRFATHNGNPIPLPITITAVSAYMGIVDGSTTATGGGAWASIFGPVNTAGTATTGGFIGSFNLGLDPGTFNAMAMAGTFTGTGNGSFLVGVWNPGAGTTTGPTPCATDCVGFDSNGAVFNGMAVQDINGGDFNPIAGANALMRVSGSVVPVELMGFTIE